MHLHFPSSAAVHHAGGLRCKHQSSGRALLLPLLPPHTTASPARSRHTRSGGIISGRHSSRRIAAAASSSEGAGAAAAADGQDDGGTLNGEPLTAVIADVLRKHKSQQKVGEEVGWGCRSLLKVTCILSTLIQTSTFHNLQPQPPPKHPRPHTTQPTNPPTTPARPAAAARQRRGRRHAVRHPHVGHQRGAIDPGGRMEQQRYGCAADGHAGCLSGGAGCGGWWSCGREWSWDLHCSALHVRLVLVWVGCLQCRQGCIGKLRDAPPPSTPTPHTTGAYGVPRIHSAPSHGAGQHEHCAGVGAPRRHQFRALFDRST